MTFISYAQNAEDVILFRALKHVEAGFYIDIGAQDPINDSVTRAFYDRGWHGINVDPVQRWFDRLNEDRPRDLNIRAIIADAQGTETIREVVGTGLSTVDEDIARQHSLGGHEVREFQVRATTLDDLCRENDVGTIHFLKVDVEGHEAKVLAGMSFDRYRPWVLLIEATAPNSQVETHGTWEPRVLAHGYRFVYADGLNRFYVADEKYDELKDSFRYPPNFFDDYERMPVAWLRQHAERLERDLVDVAGERDDLLAGGRASTRDVSEHDMLVIMRERYRRLRAQQVLLNRRLRDAQAEDNRAATRYRLELSSMREIVADVEQQRTLQRGEINDLRHYVGVLEEHARHLEAAVALERGEASRIRANFDVVMASSSWRLTKPLRAIRRILSNPVPGDRRGAIRSVVRLGLRAGYRVPGVRPAAKAILGRMPRLKARLLRIYGVSATDASGTFPLNAGGLSPAAMRYSQVLKGADEQHRVSGEGSE
ncbi:MAG: FkbM family methyltransferase [Luteibacter sp.]